MKPTGAALAGFGIGVLYFLFEEMNQPPGANCSYLSPATTDVFAFAGSGLLIWRGHERADSLVAGVGGVVAGIHACQLLHFKLTGR